MEDWINALKSAATNQYYEGTDQFHSLLSGQHNWYATSHARPTYCNVCREALSGVTSHGLSCEVCKCKAHKRCAAKALNNCKWTTLASVGKDILEDEEGNLAMAHQWLEGNLPVSAKCAVCDKTCGSVLRLQDWRCLWCRDVVHTACRPLFSVRCPLGPCRVSIVPPTALTTIGTDESWEATRPQGCSPLLVFVNSKSGDNQGVRFLRRFKQLLNPAQVFDLMNGGPTLGLRLFRCFNPFRIMICSGDGSVGWVLSEIDKLHMTNQCQVGVLPLGTGNDLARVLGWGSACDDDTHVPAILEKYERATTKMLDRWSIMSYVSHVPMSPPSKLDSLTPHSLQSQVAEYENSVGMHLATLLQSNQHSVVIASAKVLCETIKSLIVKVGNGYADMEESEVDSLSSKCAILNDKLDCLLRTLQEESMASLSSSATPEDSSAVDDSPEVSVETEGVDKSSLEKEEKSEGHRQTRKKTRRKHFIEKDALMSRANSLKKAVRQIIEHTERIVDDQNAETVARYNAPEIRLEYAEDEEVEKPKPDGEEEQPGMRRGLQVLPTIEASSTEPSPCPSPQLPSFPTFTSTITTNFPLPPASPVPPSTATISSVHLLQPSPDGSDNNIDELSKTYEAISPLPDIRRGSHCEFEFPTNIPVPMEFADPEAANAREVMEYKEIPVEDIQVRIQSSTDNLLDVGENEPVMFEEKSLTEIRDSLLNSLNNSLDIEEIECEVEEEGEGESEKEKESKDEIKEAVEELGDREAFLRRDEEEREKADTDRGVPHQESMDEAEAPEEPEEAEGEEMVGEGSVPDNVASIKETGEGEERGNENDAEEEYERRGEEESGEDEISIPRERIVEGAEATTEDEQEEEGKGEDTKHPSLPCESSSALPCQQATVEPQPPLALQTNPPCSQPETHLRLLTSSLNCPSETHLNLLTPTAAVIPISPIQPGSSSQSSQGSSLSIPQWSTPRPVSPPWPSMLAPSSSQMPTREDYACNSSSSLSPRFVHVGYRYLTPPSPFPSSTSLCPTPPPTPTSTCSTSHLSEGGVLMYPPSPSASRRISSGSTLKMAASRISTLGVTNTLARDGKNKSPERRGGSGCSSSRSARKQLPIINPLVSLPMWPNIATGGSTGGLISKVLLANADALCAAASPLMDLDDSVLDGFHERCVMNNYFGIGIDAKITLDFHNKREEHPEKCRSRTKNFMWYGVLASKEWLCKTYKNLDQRVQLECDGERIPLPSLQGIVVLNIPSFMGGTNFWGGTKEDDCFLAPSFDDKILEVVAVFGSAQMAASRIINLQHHRIAQCSSIKITIQGEEGVPIQVDGEAWHQPPGIVRIVHKNRVQMLCRNRDLEVSLRAWEEKQRSSGNQTKQLTLLADEELPGLTSLAIVVGEMISAVRLAAISTPALENHLTEMANATSGFLDRVWRDGKVIEGPNLRMLATELVTSVHTLHNEIVTQFKDKSLALNGTVEDNLRTVLAKVDAELKKAHEKDSLVHFMATEEEHQALADRSKRPHRGVMFKLKLKRDGKKSGMENEVKDWGPEEVAAWLDAIHLTEYREAFISNDIRGPELLNLERRDLKELGMTKIGHIKRVQQGIKDIKESHKVHPN